MIEPVAESLPSTDGRVPRMLTVVIKAAAVTPESRQIEDPFITMYAEGMAIAPPLEPERLLVLAEEAAAAHGACLEAKADDTVGRGWRLEATKTPDEGEAPDDEAKTTEIADLLESLTPEFTFQELLGQATWEREAIGWSGWEIVPSGNDPVGAIYPMRAHEIRATKTTNVWVQIVGAVTKYFGRFGTDVKVNGRTGALDGEDQQVGGGRRRRRRNGVSVDDLATNLLLFRGYSSRTRQYAIPRWTPVIPALAELTAIREFNVSFFGSGGTVDRIVFVKSGSIDESKLIADDIRKQVEENAGKQHVSIFTGGGPDSDVIVKFLVPGAESGRRDGSFGGRRGELVEEVLMGHKVPPYRVSRAITGALGGAPTREMLHTYRIGTIEPAQTILESRLNQTIFGKPGLNLPGYRWVLEDLDWDETELDLSIARDLVDRAIATPNDGRDITGLGRMDDHPELDAFYYRGIPLGQMPPAGPGSPARELASFAQFREEVEDALRAATSDNGHRYVTPAEATALVAQELGR
ncbi:MAG TPA: hypothetical protein VGQ58_04535 [Candidatus Limnocylindrales bacterium]|jgi:capsid portal protein|nr:hypothetical protein [Candidatus Limnocylindrales bacterium]